MSDFICPDCKRTLEQTRKSCGVYWECPGCGGAAATTAYLRRFLPQNEIQNIWQIAKKAEYFDGGCCPSCAQLMVAAKVPTRLLPATIELCTNCSIGWIGGTEVDKVELAGEDIYEQRARSGLGGSDLSFNADKAVAMYKVDRLAKEHKESLAGDDGPAYWWQYLLGFLGFPVVFNAPRLKRWPVVTLALAGFILALNIVVISLGSEAHRSIIQSFGLIPAEFFRYGGITSITSFFLHGDYGHLIGNMYFLVVFGSTVEDAIGSVRFSLLLVVATLAGGILHSLFFINSAVPCIGASGGISGIILFYIVRFPKVRFGILLWIYFYIRWIRLPVFIWAGLWIIYQLFLAWMQLSGYTSVSALAHLGGAAMGVLFYFWDKKTKSTVYARPPVFQ